MSRQEQLAWPKTGAATDIGLPAAAGGAPASKNRSPAPVPGGGDGFADARPSAAPAASIDAARTAAPATQDRARVLHDVALPAGDWRTRIVRDDTGFEALADAWRRVLSECDQPNVFLSHEWMHAWWSAYRPAAELAIVVVERGGRVRGIAPLMIETVRRGGLRVRVLRMIGDGSGETDHTGFPVSGADGREAMTHLLAAIDALPWDIAEFNQWPEASSATQALLAWIAARGLPHAIETKPCPVRRLPARVDEVLSSLPGRLRTSIRSSRKKLQQKYTVEFGLHEDPGGLDEALDRFFANHESRWNGKGRAGVFSNPDRAAFYRQLTPRLLARGWLRFFYLKLDGRPVAHQYCFAVDGTVMLLQEGFDFAHAGDNVGNVLRALVFEHLVDTGAECYDFLMGSSRHKQSWADGEVVDLRIGCARRNWRGRLVFSLPHLWDRQEERLKDRLRPLRDRLLALRGTARTDGSDA